MVFTKISALVQTRWRILRSAFDAESHERRVQQRQAKMLSKKQRRAARRAAREARRAQRTAEALRCAVANESANFLKTEPSGGRRIAIDSRSLQESSPECVDGIPVVADVTTLAVARAIEAVPQLNVKLEFEIEAQLEQKQREFYDSFGGYSTVDEDDDELLPAIMVGGGHAFDAKLPSNKTVVGIKKATTLTQESKAVMPEATKQEKATSARTFVYLAASPSSKPESFSSSSELVETEPEDEEVDLRDSAAFDGYNTFDEEEKSQGLFMTNSEFNELCALPSDNSSTQCSGEVSIDILESKVQPNWCDVGQDVKVKNKDEEVAVEIFLEIGLTEEEAPEVSIRLEELDTKKSSRMHNFFNEHVLETTQHLHARDKHIEEQSVGTNFEEVLEGPEAAKEVNTESRGMSKDVEIVEQEFMIEEKKSLLPADDDMLCQQVNAPASPSQSLVQSCIPPPGIYSPGTVDEYTCSIYESLRTREHRYHVTEDIFAKQQSVRPKMRAVLVDWLVEVHQRFELEAQTLYLTINYVDRYLAQVSVNSQRFQLVGVAALLIASKFEEIYPCDMEDLLYICERSYLKTDLVDCERDLLNVFKFNLAVPSVSSFLGYYLEHFEEDDKFIGQLANYFAECSLLDFTFGATYEPSIVACACLLAAYCYIENQAPSLVWNYRLVELTGYAVEAIVPCTQDLSPILIQPTELTAIATKYSGIEFGEVACLLLDDLEVLLF
ncbi:unnamed protein product [Peronospora destructor]|uniref:Cyclin N-terminal domain-containing protein n=1 Tax=Peronospora destructor TaxID=86335 RepID=A0AAV0UE65_9STRA|nr:unnamed protein product [Peronospora destructor]